MSELNIDRWVVRLVGADMPLFNRTVQHVAGIVNQENSSFSELAWSILEDPALTSRVLKLANSTFFNPYSKRITTVSRAVMRLGTDAIKEICVAIALIESVLSGPNKERVAVEVARSFHAAVQARTMAIKVNLPNPEEVFIAALLARIGNIAFWCFAGELGPKLESAMLECESEEQAELEVLGFKLERLTVRLSQEWKLSELLERSLRFKGENDPRIRGIKLGCAVAISSEKGWDSPETGKTIKAVSDYIRLPEKETTEILHESARDAARVTESYGTKNISRLVPIPEEAGSVRSDQVAREDIPEELSSPDQTTMQEVREEPAAVPEEPAGVSEEPVEEKYPCPDPTIQLGSLRDLSALMTAGSGDLNMVLSIVLEGIYRGIGMDTVVFALVTADRQHLKGKYGLGRLDPGWVENFTVDAGSDAENAFVHVLQNRKPLWVPEKPDFWIRQLLSTQLTEAVGGVPFFVMPVFIKDVPIGVVYADRKSSGRKLDEESFDNFTFFGQQANMSLGVLAGD